MNEHKIEIVCADLRITADTSKGCWIIERQWIKNNEWIEWCTIPIQISQEFENDEL